MTNRVSLKLAGVVLALFLATPVFAASTPAKTASTILTPVIAVVDVQRLLQESAAAKSVQKQLESQRAKFQTEISGEEGKLRKAEQDLLKLRETVTPDVYSDREQALRQKFLTVERRVQARRKALDQALTDSMASVRQSMLEITGVVAHDHGANLVLVKQQVLWSDKTMDITNEILARLNQTMPQVPVKIVIDEDEKTPATTPH